MTFEEPDPDDPTLPNWGFPEFSPHAAQWLIRWYRGNGQFTGASIPKPDALEWIRANPEAVAESQAQVQTWLKGLGR